MSKIKSRATIVSPHGPTVQVLSDLTAIDLEKHIADLRLRHKPLWMNSLSEDKSTVERVMFEWSNVFVIVVISMEQPQIVIARPQPPNVSIQ